MATIIDMREHTSQKREPNNTGYIDASIALLGQLDSAEASIITKGIAKEMEIGRRIHQDVTNGKRYPQRSS